MVIELKKEIKELEDNLAATLQRGRCRSALRIEPQDTKIKDLAGTN